MKRSSAISRRASMALNRLRTDDSPKPSCSSSLIFAIARFEREDVARLLDPALLEEQLDLLLAQPLDVEGAARDEMLQVLDLLIRAGELAGAACDHPLTAGRGGLAHHRGVQRTRAMTGKLVRLRPFGRFSSTTPSTCGMTSPARWIVTVSPMRTSSRSISSALCKRGVRHHHAADGHRLEPAIGVSAPVRPT